MKILFHCVYFPPEVGGLESHVYELARGLVEEGHEARVVTGLAYLDDAVRPPGFYPHAWVELDLGEGRRVPVDPALDLPIADATHVVLRHGLSVLGDAALEVVEIR